MRCDRGVVTALSRRTASSGRGPPPRPAASARPGASPVCGRRGAGACTSCDGGSSPHPNACRVTREASWPSTAAPVGRCGAPGPAGFIDPPTGRAQGGRQAGAGDQTRARNRHPGRDAHRFRSRTARPSSAPTGVLGPHTSPAAPAPIHADRRMRPSAASTTECGDTTCAARSPWALARTGGELVHEAQQAPSRLALQRDEHDASTFTVTGAGCPCISCTTLQPRDYTTVTRRPFPPATTHEPETTLPPTCLSDVLRTDLPPRLSAQVRSVALPIWHAPPTDN
jgi:hypothetical protein